MKKYVKRRRKLPDFDSLPAYLRNLRAISPIIYARFYGNFVTTTGKLRRFSFQVKLNANLRGKEKYRIVRAVCGRLLLNKIPDHEPGQVFSFSQLWHQTRWVRVRTLRQYEVGMVYG